MEKYNTAKVALQNMLLKRTTGQLEDTFFFDDDDSIFSMENENRFQSRATLYGRSNVNRGYSTVTSNNGNEAQSQQFSKTMRQSLYKRKKEPSPQSEDKQYQAPSWLQRMRPSLYRRREQIPSGDDTTGLMAISQSPPTGEDQLLADNSAAGHEDLEEEHEDPETSILRQHKINAMYWSAKIKDEFTTQLLKKTNLVTIDH